MEWKDKITLAIATWGAVLSTIALVWNVLRARGDRGNIKVSARITVVSKRELEKRGDDVARALLKNVDETENNLRRLQITVFNIGKRPITLKAIHVTTNETGSINRGKFVICYDGRASVFESDLPKVIAEGDFHVLELGTHVINEFFTGIVAEDSRGEKFALPRREVARLRKQVANLALPEEKSLMLLKEKFARKNWWKFWRKGSSNRREGARD